MREDAALGTGAAWLDCRSVGSNMESERDWTNVNGVRRTVRTLSVEMSFIVIRMVWETGYARDGIG